MIIKKQINEYVAAVLAGINKKNSKKYYSLHNFDVSHYIVEQAIQGIDIGVAINYWNDNEIPFSAMECGGIDWAKSMKGRDYWSEVDSMFSNPKVFKLNRG